MIVLIDDSIIKQNFYMNSPRFQKIRKYCSITLCQIVLDKVFAEYEKQHSDLDEYKDYIDNFLLENGSVYPEEYPREKDTISDSDILFWKNCFYLYTHYVMEDIHIITENSDFFGGQSEIYKTVQADLKSHTAEFNNIYFWKSVDDFYNAVISSKESKEKLIEKMQAEIDDKFMDSLAEKIISIINEEEELITSLQIEQIEIDDVLQISDSLYQFSLCAESEYTFYDGRTEVYYVDCSVEYDKEKKTITECTLDYDCWC